MIWALARALTVPPRGTVCRGLDVTDWDVRAYIDRINYHGPIAPNLETLRGLHLAHLLTVPFENLDIHLGRPIVLDLGRLFTKIVERGRGGFCYELNGLFADLLRALGFRLDLLSARVGGSDGGFGPEFDHLALLVHLERRWLADVGFGKSFRQPLLLDDPEPQTQDGIAYRVGCVGEEWTFAQRQPPDEWKSEYRFTLTPRRLGDFAAMCRYQQTSPESHFTRGRLCSRALPEGHVTLSEHRLIVEEEGRREERIIDGAAAFDAALLARFGLDLDMP